MHLSCKTIKSLCAVTYDGNIINISNKVFRKWTSLKSQSGDGKNNIFIACDYRFREKTLEWHDNMSAFCHPFRDDYTSLFPDKPKFLFSESDMVDPKWIYSGCTSSKSKYDFVFFTIDSIQGVNCKGYHTLSLLDKASGILGLKGLVIDFYSFRNPGKRGDIISGKVEKGSQENNLLISRELARRLENIKYKKDNLDEKRLCSLLRSVKFQFFGNTRDCSPRMITEALIRGTPILVNNKIYGGWKYVNSTNGALFNGPMNSFEIVKHKDNYLDNLVNSLKYMVETQFNREDIIKNYLSEYGFINSSRRLALIINKIEGHNNYKFVSYYELKHILKKIKHIEAPLGITI